MIRVAPLLRIKDSPSPPAQFYCCAQKADSRVFTQPGSNPVVGQDLRIVPLCGGEQTLKLGMSAWHPNAVYLEWSSEPPLVAKPENAAASDHIRFEPNLDDGCAAPDHRGGRAAVVDQEAAGSRLWADFG